MIITKAVIYAAGAALLASLAWGGWQCSQKNDAQYGQLVAEKALVINAKNAAEAARQAEARARAVEQASARRMADIGYRYEQDRINAQATADRVVSDLRAGAVSLHRRWQACAATADLSATDAGFASAAAAADDRAGSAARIVRAAAQCDAQVRGLQAVVTADRDQVTP